MRIYVLAHARTGVGSCLYRRWLMPVQAFANSCTGVCLCPQQLPQQPVASLLHVVPGGPEVAGVPGVGHVAGSVRVVHQQGDLAVGVGTEEPLQVTQVVAVHGDNVIVVAVVGAGHLAGGLAVAGDTVLGKHPLRRRINGVADLLATRRGRSNLKPLRKSALRHLLYQHKLGHGTATDVPVANKGNSIHVVSHFVDYTRRKDSKKVFKHNEC